MTRPQHGFTLLELLIVLAIIALGASVVAVAIPDNEQRQLEKESVRLIAILESARSLARSSSIAVVWEATETGFVFDGLPNVSLPGGNNKAEAWLQPQTKCSRCPALTLGPEPMIGRQSILLTLGNSSNRISTDGLRQFAIDNLDEQF